MAADAALWHDLPMEPFDWITDEITSNVGGKPGSRRWEIITACFGWVAAMSLVSSLAVSMVGYPSFAWYGFTAFSAALWVALKRDWKKLRRKKD
jgi:hypothetical protein